MAKTPKAARKIRICFVFQGRLKGLQVAFIEMGWKGETNVDNDPKGSKTRCDSHDLATLARSDCSKEFHGTKQGFRGCKGVVWYFVNLELSENVRTDAQNANRGEGSFS